MHSKKTPSPHHAPPDSSSISAAAELAIRPDAPNRHQATRLPPELTLRDTADDPVRGLQQRGIHAWPADARRETAARRADAQAKERYFRREDGAALLGGRSAAYRESTVPATAPTGTVLTFEEAPL